MLELCICKLQFDLTVSHTRSRTNEIVREKLSAGNRWLFTDVKQKQFLNSDMVSWFVLFIMKSTVS